ncbi:hypothetical protein GTY48_15580 [Bacillus thuringiensis]|uniref:hypothetical protein n=1 Tax=Bacillus thuringiensis TaxID=1428 RepID=UPI0013719B3B|nr:hypothetical protein [Bacillus thuringiensis]MYW24988.1 hypothetical protein [Bacillus thuringiensis]MYW25067.1 hypothetical protein [Bacillus thuringiensis]
MNEFVDLTGKTFGRLTVLSLSHKARNGTYFNCICECGVEKKVVRNKLTTGKTVSCGCYHKEKVTKHGDHKTRLYGIWKGMKDRCFLPTKKRYEDYGGRGITVCKEWLDYSNFKEWSMSNGYEEHLTIERKDFNGNYTPNNCEWIPLEEQLKNTRRSVFITYEGETRVLSDWARYFGINYQTLKGRYWRGDRGEKLFRKTDKSS